METDMAAKGANRAVLILFLSGFFLYLLLIPAYAYEATAQPDAISESSPATSGQKGYIERLTSRISQVWNAPTLDIYVPFLAWHNRLMWDSDERFNEFAYGFGLGKTIHDEDGDTHSLGIMGFCDSGKEFQPYMGYVYTKNWAFDEAKDFRVGIGFTLGLTARKEYLGVDFNYFPPIPVVLPVVGIEYKQLALQATYIPGGRNNNNVLFTWARMTLLDW